MAGFRVDIQAMKRFTRHMTNLSIILAMETINAHITAGHAYWDANGDLVLIAADGVHLLGGCNTASPANIVISTGQYLTEHSSPENW